MTLWGLLHVIYPCIPHVYVLTHCKHLPPEKSRDTVKESISFMCIVCVCRWYYTCTTDHFQGRHVYVCLYRLVPRPCPELSATIPWMPSWSWSWSSSGTLETQPTPPVQRSTYSTRSGNTTLNIHTHKYMYTLRVCRCTRISSTSITFHSICCRFWQQWPMFSSMIMRTDQLNFTS